MKKTKWFEIRNAASAAAATDILLYGLIGGDWNGDGVAAVDFVNELKQIPPGTPINLHIHSPGGSVFDGLAIYNAIQARAQDITAIVDGIALSAASFIAMAASKVIMPKTSRLMIHDAQGFVVGDSADMQEMADLLDRESSRIAQIYADKTGMSPEKIRDLMKETTWMDGPEALDLGFADELTTTPAVANTFDLNMFRRVPDALNKTNPLGGNNTKPPELNIMNRLQVIALLTKHGVTVDNSLSDADLATLLDQTLQLRNAAPAAPAAPPATLAPPVAAGSSDEIASLRSQVTALRTTQITNELNLLATERDIVAADWLPLVLNNEAMLANIRKLPKKALAGADPVAFGIANLGNPLVEAYAKMKPGAERNTFRIANHVELVRQRQVADPRNVNTIAAALTTDYLADGVITVANNRLAPLTYFNTDFSQDGYKPRATVQIRNATTTSAAQTDPVNFELGDTTLNNIPVAMHQVSKSFQVTNDELNRGTRLAFLADVNAGTFVNAISDVWTTLLKGLAPDFGAGLLVGTAATFDATKLPPILEAAKNFPQQNLLIDGSYIAHLMPANTFGFPRTPGNGFKDAYGFNVITPQNRWLGALANTVGLVCSRNALAIVAGLPLDLPPGEMIAQAVVTLPDVDLSVQVNTWFSRAGRIQWASYDVMFGAAVGDKTVGKILISA